LFLSYYLHLLFLGWLHGVGVGDPVFDGVWRLVADSQEKYSLVAEFFVSLAEPGTNLVTHLVREKNKSLFVITLPNKKDYK
jgi:hypothetical protein